MHPKVVVRPLELPSPLGVRVDCSLQAKRELINRRRILVRPYCSRRGKSEDVGIEDRERSMGWLLAAIWKETGSRYDWHE